MLASTNLRSINNSSFDMQLIHNVLKKLRQQTIVSAINRIRTNATFPIAAASKATMTVSQPAEPIHNHFNAFEKEMSMNDLLANNHKWAEETRKTMPSFFSSLAKGQHPQILWIGCSDSRVPPTDILKLGPGDAFVHRNIANVVSETDHSFLSVLQYAVDVLKVHHIVVCGHYGCGGVHAALGGHQSGVLDDWLAPVRNVYARHRNEIDAQNGDGMRADLLSELNVMESVRRVASMPIVQEAWGRNQQLAVHGWVYGVSDGEIRDLHVEVDSKKKLEELNAIEERHH